MAPPQNLEAESRCSARCCSRTPPCRRSSSTSGCIPRTSTGRRHGMVFAAMLDLHSGGEPVDALTLVEHLKRRSARAGRRPGGDRPAGGQRPRRRPCAPVRADRARERDAAPAAARRLRDPGARALPRRAAARARRHRRALDPRGRPRGQPKDFRAIDDVLDARSQARAALAGGQGDHRHAVGLRRSRQHHGRLPAGQPDHPGRKTVDGKVRPHGELRRERRARLDKAVALFSLEMSESELAQRFIASQASIKGDDLRKGRCRRRAGPRSWRRRTGSRSRRCSSTTRPTCRSSTCARRRAGCSSSTRTGSG